ncbi:MAG: hypothetical protein AAFP19_20700 [Bacteroidota bacterium]
MSRALLCLFCLFAWCQLMAQNDQLSNWRTQRLSIDSSVQSIDSLPIVPSSLTVFHAKSGAEIDSSQYQISGHTISWAKALVQEKSLIQVDVRYRVLAYPLEKPLQHVDTSQVFQRKNEDGLLSFEYSPYDPGQQLVDFKGLDYSGSFARGLSFGNSQNLVLNSSFNLQMAGKLGDDVEILAAITDQNIPLQAEGNTQQLQEFDRIFIQLKKQNNTFIAGDYELQRPNSYFMNYFKKLQGATFQNSRSLFEKGRLTTKVSGAIARGKFARNVIEQIEGNQGPYKLRGGEGERFIIVLAGTEKVFIDGFLLKRGLEEDYIIDYNRGDITFTANRLITKDTRIIVEFEYADQNYLRSMYAVSSEYQDERWKIQFNLYSEQDGKNSGSNQELDSLDRSRLRMIGDDIDNALGNGIDTLDEFNEFRVKYKLVDTSYVIGGQTLEESVLVYTTSEDSARFTAAFLEVGFGNGDYVIDELTAANGRVYKWVAPQPNGQRQGNFSPGQKLIAPNQQQMYSLGATYQLKKNATLRTEVALSNKDLNRFSPLDDDDNAGLAVFSHYQQRSGVGKGDWELQTDVRYEYVQQNFVALNPYRPAEFTRDWNLFSAQLNSGVPGRDGLVKANEHLANAALQIAKGQNASLEYAFGTFLRGNFYNGIRHQVVGRFRKAGFDIDVQGSLLESNSEVETSRFFRPRVNISKTFEQLGNWTLGLQSEREKNSRKALNSDSLNLSSFYFDRYRFFLKSAEKEQFGVELGYAQRFDYSPVGDAFELLTSADEFTLLGHWNQSRVSQLKWNLSYRELEIDNPEQTTLDPQKTFLGLAEHNLNLLKGAIRSSTNYQIGSGQEPKVQFTYLQVNPGEGTHIWLDSINNNDGQIQLNEMEIAPFQDIADYIRVSTFTDEFIRTNNVQLNQSLRFDPRRLWYQKKDIRRFLSKFSTQSTLIINRRTREADGVSPWNPFQLDIIDSALVAINSRVANTLFFNRNSPSYDVQLGFFINRNRTVLTSGFESRVLNEQFVRSRWNLSQKFSSQLYLSFGNSENDSEFFDQRDYNIREFKVEPRFTFLPTKNFRSILTYNFKQNENTLPQGGERSTHHNFNLETTLNQASSTAIRLNLSYVLIDYQGETNSPVEFAMLQGLQDGKNYLWNVLIDRRLGQNIQLSISYEGRKTGINPIVHVGRAQVRATF